jgi:calcineurin-like phosphoesterase family protein
MSKVWFASDQHFNHNNIIKYCNRPFVNLEEMHKTFILNHNAVVKPEDEVYHLGDFAFKNHKQYLRQLNGTHYLIKGNHEGNDWKDAGFKWCREVATIKVEKEFIFLSHYAHRVWNRAHYGVYHAFGHSHGGMPDYCRSCDVGVDAWNYKPVSMDQLILRFKDVPLIKHHER